MNRIAVLVLVLLGASSCLLTAFATANIPDSAPQFYFTRLAYTEDGSHGIGRAGPWIRPVQTASSWAESIG